MKMYIPFGDWSDDGHGRYKKILVESPSMKDLLRAQKKIKKKYGNDFFQHMAEVCEEPCFGNDIWQALIDTNYPVERMIRFDSCNEWKSCQSLEEVLTLDDCPYLDLEFVIDAFIWLLNSFGALIIRLPAEDDIPMICNWTCPGFETVGYGCFDF